MGSIGCPETSVRNYHNSLRNNLEERSFQVEICYKIFSCLRYSGLQRFIITTTGIDIEFRM